MDNTVCCDGNDAFHILKCQPIPDYSKPECLVRCPVVSVRDGWATVLVKNRFALGDTLEIFHPDGNTVISLENMSDEEGQAISVAPGSGHRVRIPLDARYDGAFIARRLGNGGQNGERGE